MSALALLALALSAQPPLIRLGADARAVLRIQSEGPPAVSASVGRVESLHKTEDGAWEADYVPPEEALPQVALLAVISGEDAAWIAIPLWGEGDAVVKTRPRGRISVEIGDQTFGPVVADEHGEAVVPVVVPPGVQEAHHGKRVIPLHVPPSRTLHVALGEAQPSADRAQTVAVYVAAADARGEPRRTAAIRLSSSRGDLSALHEREPGLYQAWLSLSPGAPGPVRVTAAFDDAPGFVAETALALGGGPARQIAIAADREKIRADDPQARLHVIARDAAGNAPGDALQFESDAGEVVATAAAAGEWDLTLTLPSAFAGRQSVEVRATAAHASAKRALPLVAGAPQTVAFERPSASVVADGASHLRLKVQVVDRFGNAVEGVRPEISADQGTAAIEENGGALYASYVPPALRSRGGTTLSLRAGELVGRTQVTLLPDVKAIAISPKAGLLSNLSGFSAPLLGVEGAFRTDRLGPLLAFALEADYAYRAQSELVRSGTAEALAESRIDLLLVHLSASWRRQFADANTLWISAGPSAAAYWTRVGATGAPVRRGFAVAPGLSGAIGAERRMRWATPFLEARASWITSPDLPILTGPLRTISFLAGVRLETR